jgi:MtN3 and saliva related transmembrane protein
MRPIPVASFHTLSTTTVLNREDGLDGIELLGLMAGVLTTFAFLPQAVKTWRTGQADDFSLPTLLILEGGVGLWAIYGVLRGAPSVWIGNGITLVLAAFILSVKLRQTWPRGA